jgi:hypothetical protein
MGMQAAKDTEGLAEFKFKVVCTGEEEEKWIDRCRRRRR